MVVVDGGLIVDAGRWDGRPARDLGEVVIMPGLVNSHCHLDYTAMRGAILSSQHFSTWIRRINELKRTLTDEDYLASISAGFSDMLGRGTTCVLNIESFPELMLHLPAPPLRTWWFYEMMDVRNRVHTEEVVAGALSFFEDRRGWSGGFGLSPHAPYTTSPALYRSARFCCEKYGMPFTTHLAESVEESEMFRDGAGELFDFLQGLGRNMSDTGRCSPIAHLMENDALPEGALLVHMNHLEHSDWDLLRGKNFHIVHCPRCHDYFKRPPFPLKRFLEEGFNVCLGTDSLASNSSLDMFAEMRQLARTYPDLDPHTILDMVTRNPARALGLSGRLGSILPGAFADLVAIPFSGNPLTAVESVVSHEGEVAWVMVAGRPIK